jgi:N-acetyl-beta-hexosaminidase
MPKEFVKKYIDLIALQKMNTFHWHLTEDQGWRIEIKKYPRLTQVGAWRTQTVVGHRPVARTPPRGSSTASGTAASIRRTTSARSSRMRATGS